MNCDGTESDVLTGCNKNDQIEGSNCLYGNAVGVKCFSELYYPTCMHIHK